MSSIATIYAPSVMAVHKRVHKKVRFAPLNKLGQETFTPSTAKLLVGKGPIIQPTIGEDKVPQGFILTCVTHGSWFRGTHFSDSQSYIYICKNIASPSPASSTIVRAITSILDKGYGSPSFESPRRVSKGLESDVAALKAKNDNYDGFVQVNFDDVWSFRLARLAARHAEGEWKKMKSGRETMTPGQKTYFDVSGRKRCSASTVHQLFAI
ncbi:hypothetical protein L198_00088 [Cryptococcus wingfieldii CBS 7118]|uniref:Uncharacterized protein n=1 Tax=Cryptococcus wingfieldii CBS 7118 TaxID=1295528 RepID=A0A1E3K674_9TREE|nr:hypothetical protein L198_00088 [Cryptococcus wingfieldii CBS 7118]ODO08363.1 hypothetical protein L198_00088 [Cryptococcus wingfieldii CBS 7118]